MQNELNLAGVTSQVIHSTHKQLTTLKQKTEQKHGKENTLDDPGGRGGYVSPTTLPITLATKRIKKSSPFIASVQRGSNWSLIS